MNYRSSQMGWVLPLLLAPVIVFLALAYAYQWGDRPLPLVPFLILLGIFAITLLLFYKLTLELHGNVLHVVYGVGLIRIRIEMDELLETKVIRTPWYYGLGIRVTPRGMLYNIQGTRAVQIDYIRDGKRKTVMVGTADPEGLSRALKAHR
ncbi:hypothetical protein [Robiginitalea sp. SC105]|uniref:hypothetical protein n=1 Tax=Robiginitalea sp. SC105 TaxID=2762332 RepID=UPI001639508E|nr:hypothetical protein [Robiginitalea sp. SC105]MBC2838582.1 hypothetical protein [Robiginitalea sp. SC105]